ncbi:hypothetical protein IT397_01935 [Candidatus Nomurabacteria bacterium]|nr:hypothetical protein [Candidatus Nomurabacteria bacterium]
MLCKKCGTRSREEISFAENRTKLRMEWVFEKHVEVKTFIKWLLGRDGWKEELTLKGIDWLLSEYEKVTAETPAVVEEEDDVPAPVIFPT